MLTDAFKDKEQELVYDVYEKIASEFDKTRYNVWPKVKEFVMNFKCTEFPENEKLCEVGFGNGKNMLMKPKQFYGCDTCKKFIKIATRKGLNVVEGNQLNVPYADDEFDKVISIAVIHHLTTPEKRLQALKELIRITKINGFIMVQAWGVNEEKKDNLVRWASKDGNTYQRYYHYFTEGEFEKMCESCNNIEIVESFYDHENYGVVLKKIDYANC